MKYIYLDNSATTYEKPTELYRGINDFLVNSGGNAGRGGHFLSLNASREIFSARQALKKLFHLQSEENVVFLPSATYAVNTLFHGLLKRGDHVIVSNMEHNSVIRPLYALKKDGISFSVADCGIGKNLSADEIVGNIKKEIKRNTKLVFLCSSSNICSYSLPLYEIGRMCKKHKVLFGIDASQSAGHQNIDLDECGIDFLCFPSHKGLFGLQGAGGILLGKNAPLISPLVEGGNGIDSLNKDMPLFYPERLEAGTLPAISIYSIKVGCEYILQRGIENIAKKEEALFDYAKEKLLSVNNLKIYAENCRGAVMLFSIDGFSSEKIAEMLSDHNICVRSGLHCAPLAHKSLGSLKNGGGVRVSFSDFNEKNDIDTLAIALTEAKKGAVKKLDVF